MLIFLGTFAKLRKMTVTFDLSVRLEQLSPDLTDFHEILYFGIFRKYVEKIRVSLKSNNDNRYFT